MYAWVAHVFFIYFRSSYDSVGRETELFHQVLISSPFRDESLTLRHDLRHLPQPLLKVSNVPLLSVERFLEPLVLALHLLLLSFLLPYVVVHLFQLGRGSDQRVRDLPS